MSTEENEINVAIEKIEQQIKPWALIKKALSSFSVLFLIGSGVLINWILALVFLMGYFSAVSWSMLLFSLVILILVFPAAYAYTAYVYGQLVIVFEVYQEIIRPVAANIIAGILNRIINDDSPITSEKVQEEFDAETSSLWDKIPDFITNSLGIVTTIKDIIILITEQYQQGGEKEIVKERITQNVFELLDAKMSELTQPSLTNFFIIAAINLAVVFFIF